MLKRLKSTLRAANDNVPLTHTIQAALITGGAYELWRVVMIIAGHLPK